ncbi:SDR family oxidoreductase [Flavobacterium sp. CYK-4]|uniref:SDR family NAD(P)-dependent oxidoreductase n=1 Tax=Flavobacterium lotistagni TaxID=2709660 RepID=UPI001408033A|nr:SDR family oxidoreductase [Flavobacterium lotistagni]NHM07513.1 SDR family oxidoreductase [Flavobacterium lotistagni]
MKNILIIGHSSGIGKALTELLAENHNIYGTYCQHQPDFNHQNVHSFPLNILDENPDFSFLPETIDGVVYCPGAINLKPFARAKAEDFLNDYKLQVLGAIQSIQACLPKLKNSSAPSIVLFSTVAAKTGFNFHSIVSSSKGAIEGLTKALSAELAPTIRVNCIAPSITDTPLAHILLNTPEKIEANAQRHPLKKIGTATDIAQMTAFLLSEQSQWITGQIFSVDGGLSAIKS